ncbi:MAG: two component transcriptional regulator, winged helix family [Thermoleophilia bacterium]|nr:two component transcriptional regulator, winged helix family [Thermoleophilia bacterium]
MSLATARLSATLARPEHCPLCGTNRETTTLTIAGLRIDLRTRSAWASGIQLKLTAKEYDLLVYLAERTDEVVTKRRLYLDVWGYPVMPRTTRTVDSHVSRLRRKIAASGANNCVVIDNVWGTGWRLRSAGGP